MLADFAFAGLVADAPKGFPVDETWGYAMNDYHRLVSMPFRTRRDSNKSMRNAQLNRTQHVTLK